MPFGSSGGGFLPLAGGTLSGPLTIEPNDGNVIPLSIRASWNAQNQDFFAIFNTDSGVDFVTVNSLGDLVIADKTTAVLRESLQEDAQASTFTQGLRAEPITSGALPTLAFVSVRALHWRRDKQRGHNVPVTFAVPAFWRMKLTATHGTIGTGTYY